MSQLIYPRAGLLHKKPFSAEWVAPALRLSHASSHAAEDCRTAECLRCGEANAVDQIKSLSLYNAGERLVVRSLTGIAHLEADAFTNESR